MSTKQLAFEPEDDRPLISDLLLEHASSIETVRDQIKEDPLYDSSRYDDIWILRYVMSYDIEGATKAALGTMKFRHEKKLNELGDIRHTVPNCVDKCEGDKYFPCHGKYFQHAKSDDATTTTLPDKDRGVVSYYRPTEFDIDGIGENLSDEEVNDVFIYSDEANYQILDEVTRRTGRLTRQLRVWDLDNASLAELKRKFSKRDAVAMKSIEDYYPQLINFAFVVNPPSSLNIMWAFIKPFLPKRVKGKINIVSEKNVEPFLAHISEDNIPERYGGKNTEWPPVSAGTLF
mmetsp:Transcript_18927/g.26046  ORF Transcript_18927/g.26046 Transcript_18927/m.26046 type:complete len:289 (-) Transcript_18927:350-1216(-)|eukprot:CAMPEP_0185727124 /NCGR_PEP_ID=MMETSP1171-20130828/2900_1 /TAXON_ID=374046 /ORGANISM="Helicotheca tamensis, Strain CCMP826" /LENGTH=288 /DNA_ID=CAMNT_0028395627 /DNA_START=100 /DNA_END=966 /DNA_ORIENTATION=-